MVITSASYAVMKIERRVHAQALLLTAAVVVNVVIVVLFMLPRFLNYLPFVSTAYLPDQVFIVHHTFSLITLAPTLTVVLSWPGKTEEQGCLGVGRHGLTIMRATYGTGSSRSPWASWWSP